MISIIHYYYYMKNHFTITVQWRERKNARKEKCVFISEVYFTLIIQKKKSLIPPADVTER